MRVVSALAALFLFLCLGSACNTTAGIGQDVSAAGHALTGTANDVKNGPSQ